MNSSPKKRKILPPRGSPQGSPQGSPRIYAAIAIGILALLAGILYVTKPCPIHPILSFCADTGKALSEEGTYLACGCGCCGGVEPRITCVTAEELSEKILEDRGQKSSPICALAGCSFGTIYTVC